MVWYALGLGALLLATGYLVIVAKFFLGPQPTWPAESWRLACVTGDRPWWIALALITLWFLLQLLATSDQIRVWRDESSLWARAVQVSPQKPRPTLNYARALLLEGDWPGAERALYWTLALAERAHVPAYDKADAVRAAQANLQTLALMRAVTAGRK